MDRFSYRAHDSLKAGRPAQQDPDAVMRARNRQRVRDLQSVRERVEDARVRASVVVLVVLVIADVVLWAPILAGWA